MKTNIYLFTIIGIIIMFGSCTEQRTKAGQSQSNSELTSKQVDSIYIHDTVFVYYQEDAIIANGKNNNLKFNVLPNNTENNYTENNASNDNLYLSDNQNSVNISRAGINNYVYNNYDDDDDYSFFDNFSPSNHNSTPYYPHYDSYDYNYYISNTYEYNTYEYNNYFIYPQIIYSGNNHHNAYRPPHNNNNYTTGRGQGGANPTTDTTPNTKHRPSDTISVRPRDRKPKDFAFLRDSTAIRKFDSTKTILHPNAATVNLSEQPHRFVNPTVTNENPQIHQPLREIDTKIQETQQNQEIEVTKQSEIKIQQAQQLRDAEIRRQQEQQREVEIKRQQAQQQIREVEIKRQQEQQQREVEIKRQQEQQQRDAEVKRQQEQQQIRDAEIKRQ
ncbi:MAG: hypothetical protein LBV75_03320, partial [Paludibacter sp.]|nr:hypothetical protein [Paludibacter sp.]